MSQKKLFISYSSKDGVYLDRLVEQLQAAAITSIDLWDDKKIKIGQAWDKEVKDALDHSAAAILMVSAKFLNSDYIKSTEIPKMLIEKERNGLKMFPILIRPCPWQEHRWLTELQFHKPLTPISSLTVVKQEQKLSDFATEIKAELNKR